MTSYLKVPHHPAPLRPCKTRSKSEQSMWGYDKRLTHLEDVAWSNGARLRFGRPVMEARSASRSWLNRRSASAVTLYLEINHNPAVDTSADAVR